MSRMMGRSEDLYFFSDFYIENPPKIYKEDKRFITFRELRGVLDELKQEIPEEMHDYLLSEDDNIDVYFSSFHQGAVVSEDSSKEHHFIKFKSLKPRECFKDRYAFFLGQIAAGLKDDIDIHENVLPLLTVLCYLRKHGKDDEFVDMYLSRIAKTIHNFRKNHKTHEWIEERQEFCSDFILEREADEYYLDVCLGVVPTASLDAAIQIKEAGPDKVRKVMQELFQTRNENVTATDIMYANGIDTYGYGELRKQLLLRKQTNNRRRTNQ